MRRANNPTNYDERGRVKRGRKRWKVSRRQRKVQARRRELHRKLAATRKRSHGQLAHRVLALGNTFQLEQLSYRAWQKTHGKAVQLPRFGPKARGFKLNPGGVALPPGVLASRDTPHEPGDADVVSGPARPSPRSA
jgi:hypothetical protein